MSALTNGPTGLLDDDRRARVWLTRAVEPGQKVVAELLDRHGAVELVRRIRRGTVPEALRRVTESRRDLDRVDADLAGAAQRELRLLVPGDEEWPQEPLHCCRLATSRGRPGLAPPVALWVRGAGHLDRLLQRAVAVIGARESTGYGEHCAAELAFGLAERGWTVVSGGAYGIDRAAHRAALAAGGATVAFLAGGLDRPYPPGNARLFEQIAATGSLVSEWPVGSTPQRHRFLSRNRLIAAVSAGTVVVEAAARSGTAKTAEQVGHLGRVLMAVPGPITSRQSIGTHERIRSGEALLVTRVEEVIEAVGRIGDDLAPPVRATVTERDRLPAPVRRVLDGVPARRAVAPEEIAIEAAVPVAEVLRALPELEVEGFVRCTADGWQLLHRPRRRGG